MCNGARNCLISTWKCRCSKWDIIGQDELMNTILECDCNAEKEKICNKHFCSGCDQHTDDCECADHQECQDCNVKNESVEFNDDKGKYICSDCIGYKGDSESE